VNDGSIFPVISANGAWLADAASKTVTPLVTFGLGYTTARWGRISRWIRRIDPVQVHIEPDPEIIYANLPNIISFPQFIPCERTAVPSAPDKPLALYKWAKELGGSPAWAFDLQVTITAWDELDVVVDTLRVEAVERKIPSGVVVVKGVGGAAIQREQLDVKLSTTACTVTPRRAGSGTEFNGFAFQLKPGEVQRFLLHVSPKDDTDQPVDAYEWTAFLDLLVQNRRKTIQINDHGKPFVLVKREARRTVWL
jgi:hypothetical protein